MENIRFFITMCLVFIAIVQPVWPFKCVGTGSACKKNADCCGSANFATVLCAKNKCAAVRCVGTGSTCFKNSDCCGSANFATVLCNSKKKCVAVACVGSGQACKKNADCCGSNLGVKCSKKKCVVPKG